MAPRDLKNETLAIKHKKYNERVKDAIADKQEIQEKEFQAEKLDLDNLIKIDLASNAKDVDYIFSVLKCKNILYVSRALTKCQWLVEDKYENFINPQYLRDHLFPHMTAEAITKFNKFIRQHLKNESRVEEFLNSEVDPKMAAKWLSRCSVTFIESNIQTYLTHLDNLELKRICEKSVTIFEAAMEKNSFICEELLKSASFLINTHMEKYLDTVEKVQRHIRPTFNAKATNKIMKQFSDRIKNNFKIYAPLIHIPTFVKYFKSEEIKPFLFKQACKDDGCNKLPPRIFKYSSIKIFVSKMPKDEQFDFVKNFINKGCFEDNVVERDPEVLASRALCKAVCSVTPSYVWYEFAPFDIAFTEIKKLIQLETNFREKTAMLKVLLICTAGDMKHIQSVLSYYISQHIKDEIQYKDEFITNVVAHTDIPKYDDATWSLLDKILVNMDVYKETATTDQNCLEAVIIHSLIKNESIPEAVEKKLSVNTFIGYKKKLSVEDGNKVFAYLFNHAKQAIEMNPMDNKEELGEANASVNCLLNLLLDWNKELKDYPFVLDTIRSLIKINKENNWKLNLAQLYNKNKSWRKDMFEESVMLNPTEDVCVNAIKHDPELLERYKDEVETICKNDSVSLRKLLNKLRIYWSDSLADDWSKLYVSRLDKLGSHKALVRGICTILPQDDLRVILTKYVPQHAKIDWSNIDELSLSLQRGFAKNMHLARPQPSPEDILQYAKGDYLQYALPSLLSIYHNLSRVESKTEIPKLLTAPVALQKHGLRFAFTKLDHDEVKKQMSNVWKNCKNSSIRTVAFQLMFKLLQKEKKDERAIELWEILQVFVDDLSFDEDDKIYELLPRVSDVPLCVRPMFLMKSYKFLKNLVKHTKKDRDSYQYHIDRLAEYTREIIEFMPPEFIVDIIGEFVENKLFVFDKYQSDVRSGSGMVTVLSCYLMCAKDEDLQLKRYDDLFNPILKRALDTWNENCEGNYYIRQHVQIVLRCLLSDLISYTIQNKMVIPTKMFNKILSSIRNLPVSENYLMITMWKMTAKLSELIEKSNEKQDWNKICAEIAPEFGKFCLECLREDVKLYFSCIYVLFSKALEMVLGEFSLDIQLQVFEHMLSDSNFIQGYLATLKVFPKHDCDEAILMKQKQLKKIIQDHPCVEVKMHYYSNFKNDV